ncbi:NMD3-related protein [Pyrobaculum calidifontis]|uniref:NMD3 n=1 Tax=Pyrobaculum calidifontis (strain DSM 21063 / JCM 11548 / VA1) TaxID=410359 RepID=A3MTN7_PYRCJ|nr:NMD3-related protein [Pyrobaculum calidifontis]ABO08004.1 NMD3 [Pyrobaculum calidifontis JCM 11548]
MAKVPCPSCGRLVDKLIEGLCEDCYIERHPLVEYREGEILRCKYCGAVFLKGKWMRGRGDQVFLKILSEKGKVVGKVEQIDARDFTDYAELFLTLHGSPHPEIPPRTLKYNIRIPFKLDICNVCMEKLSKREVAVLQIRASPRPLDAEFKKKILHIVEQELLKLKSKKIGFVSSIKEAASGIDIYTTSANLARHLARVIHETWPSYAMETAKVVGIRDGKKVYHMTYLVRLFTYRVGDLIIVGGSEKVVTELNNKYIGVRDVQSGGYEQIPISDFVHKTVLYKGS